MSSSPMPYFLILAVFFIQGFIQVSCFEFNFPNFQNEDGNQLILSNNSYIVQQAIQVTPDFNGASTENRSGRAMYKKSFRLWKGNRTIASFNTAFVLNIPNETFHGGEGLAFIITGDSSLPENSEGRWLGIVNSDSNGSSQARRVAVEFDTKKSDDQDLDDNHIGLNTNSINSITQVSLTEYGFKIAGGKDLWVHLQYDGENLTVGVNETLVLSQRLDLSNSLPKEVFLGFSA